MTTATLRHQKPPITEAYDQSKASIYSLCHRFIGQGWSFDDLLSEAHEAFTVAYHNYDPTKSKLNTWVHNSVCYAIMEQQRLRRRRHAKLAQAGIDLEMIAQAKEGFNIQQLLNQVSGDAAFILKLALEPPPPLAESIGPVGSSKKHRTALHYYLTEMGWCAMRIAETFNEIREAL